MTDLQFQRAVSDWLDNSLDSAGIAELETCLLESESTRQRFWHQVTLHGQLYEVVRHKFAPGELTWLQQQIEADERVDHLLNAAEVAPNGPIEAASIPRSHEIAAGEPTASDKAVPALTFLGSVGATLYRPVVWSVLACGVLFGVYFAAISWGIFSKTLDHAQLAATDQKSQISNPKLAISNQQSELRQVATLTSTKNCQWQVGGDAVKLRKETRLLANDTMTLLAGTAEIKFADGAEVILEGPATFVVEEPNRGKLERGKLVAIVPQQAIGFTINTPSAEVMDLGTEFGVQVEKHGDTRVQVVRGLVDVWPLGAQRVVGQVRRLGAGETVQIDSASREVTTLINAEPIFIRRPQGDLELRLSDILCGGDGKGTRVSMGVDPATGAVSTDRRSVSIRSDDKYHKVPALPFVDGVFIPRGGRGPVVVDSAGHTFSDFPPTQKYSHGNLWVHENGAISMHANKGVVIDLHALRQYHKAVPLRFMANVCNSEPTPANAPPKYVADAWVLVDGVAKFAAISLRGAHGVKPIDVTLHPHERYLTLVATDSDGNLGNDGIRFMDARLIFKIEKIHVDGVSAKRSSVIELRGAENRRLFPAKPQGISNVVCLASTDPDCDLKFERNVNYEKFAPKF